MTETDTLVEDGALVERLRGRADWYDGMMPGTVKTPGLLREAADLIEQLREALTEAVSWIEEMLQRRRGAHSADDHDRQPQRRNDFPHGQYPKGPHPMTLVELIERVEACEGALGARLPPTANEHLQFVGFLKNEAIGEPDVEDWPAAAVGHAPVGHINADNLERLADPLFGRLVPRRLKRVTLRGIVHFARVEITAIAAVGHHKLLCFGAWLHRQAAILEHMAAHLTNISFISQWNIILLRALQSGSKTDG